VAGDPLSRRRLLGGLGAALAAAAAPLGAQETTRSNVLVVSRQRILRETRAGRALRETEARVSAEFQARVDELKDRLEREETDLARLRGTLPRDRFDARASAFDRNVRTARRETQRQAAALQKAFRDARERLVSHLAPILVEVLRAEGAEIMLDAEQILVAAPTVDMTERVIELFDERVAPPEIELGPMPPFLPEAPSDQAPPEPGDGASAE